MNILGKDMHTPHLNTQMKDTNFFFPLPYSYSPPPLSWLELDIVAVLL